MKCKWCNVSFSTLLDEDPMDIQVSALGKDNRGKTINAKYKIFLCHDCYEHLVKLVVGPEIVEQFRKKERKKCL